MRLFLDSANIEHIKEANDLGVISGVTTNPTLVAKEGRDFKKLIEEISTIVDGPVSAEVISTDFEGMLKEARELKSINENVVIKIPMTKEGLKAVKVLNSENIKTNVTLVFTSNQALLAARAGANYVSPFVGRLDDIGEKGMDVVKECVQIFAQHGLNTEVIAASIRNPLHVKKAALIGADIATIPYKTLEEMLKHPLTDKGIEKFLSDWENIKEKS